VGAEAEQDFELVVNGARCSVRCRSDTPLLYLLRDHLGLPGTRFGCGLGQCGACFVLLDGAVTPSCDLPMTSAAGRSVVTVEGLAESGRLSALRQAFVEEQAAQCGYCTSGILVSATALLARDPAPDPAAVRSALDRNLCRCGSHPRVIRAVLRAAGQVPATGGGQANGGPGT
jgi:nicotinate dehydrogenase subunit A